MLQYQLTQKFKQLGPESESEETQKLIAFCRKWLKSLCERFVQTNDSESVNGVADALNFIACNFKGEDLQKLLTKVFLEMNESYPNNLDLTVLLMKRGIISLNEWDLHISQMLRDYLQFQQNDGFVQFVISFVEETIIHKQLFTYQQFPSLVGIIEKLSAQPALAKLFSHIKEDLQQKFEWNEEALKNCFHEYVAMSFEENNPK